jgi:hypothetical protein
VSALSLHVTNNSIAWIRIILCSGPRQAVNALTLYAVYTSKLIPTSTGSIDATLVSFFGKLGTLARDQPQTAVILGGMIFTLVVWVISALSLLLAALFYVLFLWHHIPKQDGGLSGYCERKVNKRLMKIVAKTVNKALEKEERDRLKAELKAAKKAGVAGEKPMIARQATLPTFLEDSKGGDALPAMPTFDRSDTMTSTQTSIGPETPVSIEMSSFDQGRPLPRRQGTSNTFVSQSSYSTNATLLSGAAPMGMARTASPAPTLPQMDLNNYPPVRPGTAQSNRSFGPAPTLQRSLTGGSSSFGTDYVSSPSTYSAVTEPTIPTLPPVVRSPFGGSTDNYGRPMPRAVNQLSGRAGPPPSVRSGFEGPNGGRSSPAPSYFSEPAGLPARGPAMNSPAMSYANSAFAPTRSASANPEASTRQPQFSPQRNMTAPVPQRQHDADELHMPQARYDADELHITRSGTPSSQRGPPRSDFGYGNDLEAQRRNDRYY